MVSSMMPVRRLSLRLNRHSPLLLPLFLAGCAALGEGQGLQAGEGDLLAAADAAAVGPGLGALDGRVDLLELLLLLRHHGQADVTLRGRRPAVGTRRVPHLGLLLPLAERLADPCGNPLTPFSQQREKLCASSL